MPVVDFRDVGDNDVHCDRDGVAHYYPNRMCQGMDLYIDGLSLHFDDENICLLLAKKIADRLGYQVCTLSGDG